MRKTNHRGIFFRLSDNAFVFYMFLSLSFVSFISCKAHAYEFDIKDETSSKFDCSGAVKDTILKKLTSSLPPDSTAGAAENIKIIVKINDVKSRNKINSKGMLLAGGISSALTKQAVASMTLSAEKDGKEFFRETLTAQSDDYELFSAWRKSKAVKKRAVQESSKTLAGDLAEALNPGNAVSGITNNIVPADASDIMKNDEEIWKVLAGMFADIALHEGGHAAGARLIGHGSELRNNDSRTFRVGADTISALSLLFAPHFGDEQLIPIPDIFYDFARYKTPSGKQYLDENLNIVSNGRRDHALIAYSGILTQTLTNELILSKHPKLIDEDRPFLKGMLLFNLLIPSFYTIKGWSDENSDLKHYSSDLELNKWTVDSIVLIPAALDIYRFYHPEKKKFKRYSRIAKAIPVLLVFSK